MYYSSYVGYSEFNKEFSVQKEFHENIQPFQTTELVGHQQFTDFT